MNDPNWQRYFTIVTIKSFGDEIALSHYAFGFIIYYTTSQNFKYRVHQLFKLWFHYFGRCKSTIRKDHESDQLIGLSRRNQRRATNSFDKQNQWFQQQQQQQQQLTIDTNQNEEQSSVSDQMKNPVPICLTNSQIN